jgi:hypothetical protein
MDETEKAQRRQWLENWREASKTLEELRIKEIKESDVITALPAFNGALRSALWLTPNPSTSGLVEMQAIISKMKK